MRFPDGRDGVTFDSHGCKLLGGFYRAAGDTPRPTVLLLHGIPGTEKNFDLASALCAAGFNCLYFHYRGSWGSGGHYAIPQLAEDVRVALAWLLQHPAVDRARVALVGNSLGGYLTLHLSATEARFKTAIALCPLINPLEAPLTPTLFADFASMLNGVTGPELQAQWAALPPITPEALARAPHPILVITAAEDELFPPHHYHLFPGVAANVSWHTIFQADHGFQPYRAMMMQTALAWLQRTL